MDFSEFLRQLGADPHSRDPEFLRARQSSPEFQQAAEAAEAFETRLERAMVLTAPEGLLNDILEIGGESVPASAGDPHHIGSRTSRSRTSGSRTSGSRTSGSHSSGWRSMALAAGILVAVGAAGITWNMNRGWDSVDQYLAEHYSHDGDSLVNKAVKEPAANVQELFAQFAVQAAPELAGIVSVIKYCPTPDGKGIHMVLNTQEGPVTLIYMPETDVIDHETLEFGGMKALLVGLEKGSAALIGTEAQSISTLYSVVHESIVPMGSEA